MAVSGAVDRFPRAVYVDIDEGQILLIGAVNDRVFRYTF